MYKIIESETISSWPCLYIPIPFPRGNYSYSSKEVKGQIVNIVLFVGNDFLPQLPNPIAVVQKQP